MSQRARQAVSKRIRAALDKIRQAHPPLGPHLAHTVVTGYFCSYAPSAETAIAWRL